MRPIAELYLYVRFLQRPPQVSRWTLGQCRQSYDAQRRERKEGHSGLSLKE